MSKENKSVNPEMLILARELRNITQTRLAEISRVDQGTISRYEGKLKPITDFDVEAFADALELPIEFFYREGSRRGSESGELFHRKRLSLSAQHLNVIHARLNLFRLNVQELLEGVNVTSPFKIPTYNPREFRGNIEEIAQAVRAAWQMPAGPVDNLMQLLEAAFCIIHAYDFGTDLIDETVQWVEPSSPIMLVNRRAPGDRLRFSLAHALGHLVMHHNIEPYAEMEDEADEFAAAFLMPAADIRPELAPVTIEHMLQLKPAWRVSMQALIRRARDTGVINQSRYNSLFTMLSRMGYRKIEPFPLPAEKAKLFKELIALYQEQKGYSINELAQFLAISENDFWDWYLPDMPRLQLVKKRSSDQEYVNCS